MNNAFVMMDIHVRETEPYYSVTKSYFDWFLNSKYNSPDYHLFQLGDLFNSGHPSPKEVELVISFFQRLKVDSVVTIAGNHDYHKFRKYFAVEFLNEFPNVYSVYSPQQLELNGGFKVTCLPWRPKMVIDTYTEPDNFPNIENSKDAIILYHFTDESIHLPKISREKNIDLSKWKGKRFGGHIHLTDSPNYVDLPYPTRMSEQGNRNRTGTVIDPHGNVIERPALPYFLDYVSVKYGEKLNPPKELMYPYYKIYDAPSKAEVLEKYPGVHIHSIDVMGRFTVQDSDEDEEIVEGIGDYLVEYFKNNETEGLVQNNLKTLFKVGAEK